MTDKWNVKSIGDNPKFNPLIKIWVGELLGGGVAACLREVEFAWHFKIELE